MNTDLSYLDDIRDALMAPQTFDSEAMKATVAEFNDSCRDANHRLRKVVGLLHGGFRTEAVQVAEQDPPLLELVGELDSVMEDWQELLAQWGVDLPPDLEIDLAAQLNVAYAELLPLEGLLRKHRLLALVRAPLSARLTILRQIAGKDAANASWQTDVNDFETARLRQIKDEVWRRVDR